MCHLVPVQNKYIIQISFQESPQIANTINVEAAHKQGHFVDPASVTTQAISLPGLALEITAIGLFSFPAPPAPLGARRHAKCDKT